MTIRRGWCAAEEGNIWGEEEDGDVEVGAADEGEEEEEEWEDDEQEETASWDREPS